MIDLNRFLTADEIKGKYQMPAALFEKLMPLLPWQHEDEGGERYYLESRVDRFLEEFVDLLERQTGGGGIQGGGHARHQPDGMIPPDRVRVHGKEYTGLPRHQWRLLQALLCRKPVEMEAVMDAVYGHDADRTDSALDSLRKRTNDRLSRQGFPGEIGSRGGYFILEVE